MLGNTCVAVHAREKREDEERMHIITDKPPAGTVWLSIRFTDVNGKVIEERGTLIVDEDVIKKMEAIK